MSAILRLSTLCVEDGVGFDQPFVLRDGVKRVVAASNGMALVTVETRESANADPVMARRTEVVLHKCRPKREDKAVVRVRVDRLRKFCGPMSRGMARPMRIGARLFDRRLLARCLYAAGMTSGEADLVLSGGLLEPMHIVCEGKQIVLMPMRSACRPAQLPDSVLVKTRRGGA